jgi:hypothetical protein
VPLVMLAGVEGILDKLPDVGVVVHHQLLRIVASVALLCYEILSFGCLGETRPVYARPLPLASIHPSAWKGASRNLSVTKNGLDASTTVATMHRREGNNPG